MMMFRQLKKQILSKLPEQKMLFFSLSTPGLELASKMSLESIF